MNFTFLPRGPLNPEGPRLPRGPCFLETPVEAALSGVSHSVQQRCPYASSIIIVVIMTKATKLEIDHFDSIDKTLF